MTIIRMLQSTEIIASLYTHALAQSNEGFNHSAEYYTYTDVMFSSEYVPIKAIMRDIII